MQLLQSVFLKALGWSLFDSVWQMGILWILYLLFTGSGKRFTAELRHTLALGAMLIGSVWFVGELAFNLLNPSHLAFENARSLVLLEFDRFAGTLDSALPVLSALYLVASGVLFIKLVRQYRQTRSLTAEGLQKVNPSLRLFAQQMAGRMHLRRKVDVWLSDYIDSPLTIGFWKPLILLPVSAMNQLTTEQAEAIILHELHHIGRNDYLVNLLVAFSTVVLFFNPFARFLAIAIRNEREHCCDDLVMQFQYRPSDYASALLILETSRNSMNLVKVQATGTHRQYLLQRVRRILTGEPAATPVSHRLLGVFISFLFIGFIGFHGPATQLAEAMLPSMADGFVRLEMKQVDARNERKTRPHTNAPVSDIAAQQAAEPATSQELTLDPVFAEATEPTEPENILIDFASGDVPRDFSLEEDRPLANGNDPHNPHPYIPSSTLEYAFIEDTTVPKPAMANLEEIRANRAREKAVLALKEVNWIQLQKNLRLAGKQADIVALQKEVEKAMAAVDWKKVNAEAELATEEMEQSSRQLQLELEKYQSQRSKKMQELNVLREKMIIDRLEASQDMQKKTRKIVAL